MPTHIPVLLNEVISNLELTPGQIVLDGTVGLGGHAKKILELTAPDGRLYAFDRDATNLETARENLSEFGDRVTFVNDSFGNISGHDLPLVDAALFDLGFSSVHVDDATRGFSFQTEGPLDMRYDQKGETTAAMLVNQLPQDQLIAVLMTLGEEPQAVKIAKAIIEARRKKKFETTLELAELIQKTIGRHGKIHPATRTFQGLRIAVNNEFGEIRKGIESAITKLKPGGRIAIITFHSLEDRLVKQLLNGDDRLIVVNKKPITPSLEEIEENPRSRSAKLRVARRK